MLLASCSCSDSTGAALADPGGSLSAQVETLEVGVLVNHVGMSYPHDHLILVGFRMRRWK